MKPSRVDIPFVGAGVKKVDSDQLSGAITLYRNELSRAIENRDQSKMMSSGNVLVALLRRQNDLLQVRTKLGSVDIASLSSGLSPKQLASVV